MRTVLALAILLVAVPEALAQETSAGVGAQAPSGRAFTAEDLEVYRVTIDTVFAGVGRLLLPDSVAAPRVVSNDSIRFRSDLFQASFADGRAHPDAVRFPLDRLGTSVQLVAMSTSAFLAGPPPSTDPADAFASITEPFGADEAGIVSGIWYSAEREIARVDVLRVTSRGAFALKAYLGSTPKGWTLLGTDRMYSGYGPGSEE